MSLNQLKESEDWTNLKSIKNEQVKDIPSVSVDMKLKASNISCFKDMQLNLIEFLLEMCCRTIDKSIT
jgi:hypothetical protein